MQPTYVEIITLSPGNEEEPLMKKHTICGSSWRSLQKFLRSPSLLKGFAWVFGLWRPYRQLRALFALIFILPDCYNIIQSVIYAFVCPSVRSTLDSWYCGNGTRNISTTDVIVSLPFHINKRDLMDFVLKLAQLLSHLTFFWSVWVLPTKESTVGQRQTCSLVQPSRWVKLNCEIIVCFCALLVSTLWLLLDNRYSSTPYLLASALYPIPIWTSLLTCWMFSTHTSSLEILITRCIDDITSSEQLDDVIRLHQKLCKRVLATSDAMKYWFIIHWVLYTVLCVVWIAEFVYYIQILIPSLSVFFNGVLYLGVYVYVFIYPCYCAASVTGKCQQMLADFNMKDEEEWHESHPFRQREKLHLFLKYAEYANCGYMVGSLRFGSMSVFFSTLSAVIGAGLKVF